MEAHKHCSISHLYGIRSSSFLYRTIEFYKGYYHMNSCYSGHMSISASWIVHFSLMNSLEKKIYPPIEV